MLLARSIFLTLAALPLVMAQGNLGGLTGIVTDASGSIVPFAKPLPFLRARRSAIARMRLRTTISAFAWNSLGSWSAPQRPTNRLAPCGVITRCRGLAWRDYA
jgi:hypothetical protein